MQTLDRTESVLTYERILRGEIQHFSPLFFTKPVRKRRIQELMHYLVEHILHLTPEEAYETLTINILEQHQLQILLKYVEDFPEKNEERSIQWLVRLAYPHLPEESLESRVKSVYQEVLDGTRKRFPPNYFHGNIGELRAHICVQHLVEHILQLTPQKAAKTLTPDILAQYKLRILLNLFFDSLFDLLTKTYPELSYKDFSS
ncbi:DUF4046 domain-containing protein [Cytobacillus sp. FJAT-54145]|uniref:DUF4046 domain-containing protein n=1 Tax=Cytobacillus spartinae TaxID=3299023 RepID=A0ABW6K9R5_9BACI